MLSPSANRTSITTDRMRSFGGSSWPSMARSNRPFRTCCGRKSMGNHKLLAAATIVFAASALYAADRHERTISRTLTLHGGRVTVDHKFGAIKIHTTTGSEVNVRATIRASDADFGKQISLSSTERAGGVEIRTSYPDQHAHFFGDFSYSVELDGTVP